MISVRLKEFKAYTVHISDDVKHGAGRSHQT